MKTPLSLFLSDVGRTFWAAGSRRTGFIEEQGVSPKFGPNDSRSFARWSMLLALSILAGRLCSFETLKETREQTVTVVLNPQQHAARACKDSEVMTTTTKIKRPCGEAGSRLERLGW